jgi:enoyl-CoA hydratase/carnithine racemase
MSEPQSLIVYEKRDPHIAIIRLNRPEKKNSISRDLYWALDGAWHKAKDDDDVWSIILTGTADAFCVGGDLKENLAFAKGEMTGPRSGPRQYSNLRALQMHKPIIAAVNGFAVGGGFNLALACHIRYCVPALVPHGRMAELRLPTADRLGLLVCAHWTDGRRGHGVPVGAGAEDLRSRQAHR